MAVGVGELFAALGVDMTKFDAGLAQAQAKFKDLDDKLAKQQKLQSLGKGMAAAGVVGAVGLGAAVNTAMEFDTQMSKVGAIAGATGKDLENLRKTAMELGASTSYSASEAAMGMQELAAAGFDANKIIDAMPGILDSAAASGAPIAQVAEVIGSSLNTFGLEASQSTHIADVLAEAANRSALDITDMQYAMKYAGPVASQLGYSLEEVTAAMMVMGNAGIKGEQGGTVMRSAMLRLVKPPKQAAEMIAELGLNITDASGKMLPWSDVIGQLSKATAGMTEEQKANALATIFGTEAVSGLMVQVAQGKGTLDDYTKSLENSDGTAKETADVMKDNLAGAVEELGGAMESASISLGSALAPSIRKVAEVLTFAVNAFNALPEPMKKGIAVGAALTTGLLLIGGPLLFLIGALPNVAAGLGVFTSGVGKVVGVIKKLPAVLKVVSGAFKFIFANPIILAVLAVVAIGYLVWKNWDKISKQLAETWTWIKEKASKIWGGIKEFFKRWGPEIIGVLLGPIGILGVLIYRNWDSIKAKTITIWTDVKSWLGNHWNGIKTFATDKFNGIKDAVANSWYAVKRRTLDVWEEIKSAISSAVNFIKNTINGLFDKLEQLKVKAEGAKKGISYTFNGSGSTASWGNNANGTNFWGGGLTWVGENGPELLNLPRGAQVFSNQRSMEMVDRQTVTIGGTVRVEGVNNMNQLVGVAEIIAKQIEQGDRRLAGRVRVMPSMA